MTKEYSLKSVGDSFVNWFYNNHWTASGEVFDVDISTRDAIVRLKDGVEPKLAGNREERSNGNDH